jgi:hypothetical protein
MNSSRGKEKVRRLIKAFLIKDKIKYLQGMDSMAFSLLKMTNWNEPSAFSLLTNVHHKLFHNTIDTSPSLIKIDMHILQRVLTFIEPSLALYLRKISFEPELYAISWLISGYS